MVDSAGRPIPLKLTEGQAHDGRSAADMFETVQAGHVLLADHAHDICIAALWRGLSDWIKSFDYFLPTF